MADLELAAAWALLEELVPIATGTPRLLDPEVRDRMEKWLDVGREFDDPEAVDRFWKRWDDHCEGKDG